MECLKLIAVSSAILLAGCQTTMGDRGGPARVLTPETVCEFEKVPVYGVVDRPASDGEVLGGAIVGGVIGNQFGKGDGNVAMTILGAIVGGNAASTRKVEQAIIGYRTEKICKTVYK